MFAHHTDRFMTEKELIVSLKQGTKLHLLLYTECIGLKFTTFSRLYLSSIAEVEEVVQEVFVKLWEARIFLKEDESFKGFLFIITRNIIFNQFRKSFNENAYKTTVLSSAEVEYDIENEMDAADLQGYIKKLISELTPRQQEVFHLSRGTSQL